VLIAGADQQLKRYSWSTQQPQRGSEIMITIVVVATTIVACVVGLSVAIWTIIETRRRRRHVAAGKHGR